MFKGKEKKAFYLADDIFVSVYEDQQTNDN